MSTTTTEPGTTSGTSTTGTTSGSPRPPHQGRGAQGSRRTTGSSSTQSETERFNELFTELDRNIARLETKQADGTASDQDREDLEDLRESRRHMQAVRDRASKRERVSRHELDELNREVSEKLAGLDRRLGVVESDVDKIRAVLFDTNGTAHDFVKRGEVADLVGQALKDDGSGHRVATTKDLKELDDALGRRDDNGTIRFDTLDNHEQRITLLEQSGGGSSSAGNPLAKAAMVAAGVGLVAFLVAFVIAIFVTGLTYAFQAGVFWAMVAFALTFLIALVLAGRKAKKQSKSNQSSTTQP